MALRQMPRGSRIQVDGLTVDLRSAYDSPLEHLFAHEAVKHFSHRVRLLRQVDVETLCGRFVLDFLLISGWRRIAFECDGAAFHEPGRDQWRDAMILGAGGADAIYRLRGKDLMFRAEDCFYLLSHWEPTLFSERGLANLRVAASVEARDARVGIDAATIEYDSADDGPSKLVLERRLRDDPDGDRAIWRRRYALAQRVDGGALDDLAAIWWQSPEFLGQ